MEKLDFWPLSISYFDPFALFENVRTEFSQIFPLDVVRWKASDGTLRTIDRLPVQLTVEDGAEAESGTDAYLQLIIVTCISVEEYRSKVRPLLRQWLPAAMNNGDSFHMPLILLYANSEVVDSSIFKTMSLMEKFNKDFPEVQTLMLKSVYKSPKEKEEFWTQLSHQFKGFLVNVFKARISKYESRLKAVTSSPTSNLEDEIRARECLLKLYSEFRLIENAKQQLKSLKSLLHEKLKTLEPGELDRPFDVYSTTDLSIYNLLKENRLTKFVLHKSLFVKDFMLNQIDEDDSRKYSKMLTQIHRFIRNIESDFIKDEHLLEFKHYVYKNMMSLLPTDVKPESEPIVMELKAELLLAYRDIWINGVLTNTDYSLLDKKFSFNPIAYKFDIVKETFDTEDTFHKNYSHYTKEIISLLSKCNGRRQRVIDILSLEVGLLHYQRKEYIKAVNLLVSCNEYYTESKWDIIGTNILKIFVESLTNCPDIDNVMIEGEPVPVTTILSNSYLNILKSSKIVEQKKAWWDKFLELQIKDDVELIYPSEGLIDLNLDGFTYLSNPNEYAIDVHVTNNNFPQDIEVSTMKLSMKNDNDEYNEFRLDNILLKKSAEVYKLTSKNIVFGSFVPVSIEVNIGYTSIVKYLDNSNDDNIITVEPIYHKNNIWFEIEEYKNLHLGEYAIEIKDYNFDQLADMELYLEAEKTLDTLTNPISFDPEIDQPTITIDKNDFPINKKLTYYLTDQRQSFSLYAKLTYSLKGAPDIIHSFIQQINIEYYLQLSVSVEDIFKRDRFFFKFLLNASTKEEPVMVYASQLDQKDSNSTNYAISGEYKPSSPMIINNNSSESCLNCFQVTTEGIFNNKDVFELKVTYNTLREYLNSFVTDTILLEGDVGFYERYEPWKLFWVSKILPLFNYEYELYIKSRILKLVVGSIDSFSIGLLFKKMCIDHMVRTKFMKCISDLLHGIELNDIDLESYCKSWSARTLTVPVQLPELKQFFEIKFNLKETKNDSFSKSIGEPLPYEVVIKNSSEKWGQDITVEPTYTFEILSSNDWLVHGKKRMTLTSKVEEIDINLIPLRKGYLAFPQVEVTTSTGEVARVDYMNAYDIVLIF
ncbi:transport protein particle complex II subunit TRS130 RNJ42_03376 [Nakaseomyces bracarensis]|uniref:transport protein particle complex II subunit TRS130 n=1 Tax=Nakaseomyces bracarensis TaxID=273131 RepID=UPI00387104FD